MTRATHNQAAPPQAPRLLGETYRFRLTGALVVVIDHHYGRRGRTGRYVVQPLGDPGALRLLAHPEDLLSLSVTTP